ncbi:MAG: NAD(P)/FAD-dependent oxidoreductase [Verrucomicrobiales bacterium]
MPISAKKPPHVLIIGGGVIGFSCAYALLRRGHEVTIIDRGEPGAESCSTHNAGMIVPSHFIPLAAPGMIKLGLKWMLNPESPFYIRPRPDPDLANWCWKFFRASRRDRCELAMPVMRDLLVESRELFNHLAGPDEIGFELQDRGLIMLCKEGRTLDHEGEVAEKAQALGIEAQVVDPEELAKLDPGARMDVAGGVYFPGDGFLQPDQFLDRLRARVLGLGAEVLWGNAAGKFEIDGRRITAVGGNGDLRKVEEVIITGGVWSAGLASQLGVAIPMQAGKGYSVTLTQPPTLPQVCSILTEARVAVTPMGQDLRVGGTMEISGLDESVNRRRVDGIAKSLPHYFPEFGSEMFDALPVWHGLRPCSPDGLPYIGRSARYENLTIATGHAMLGLSLAPVTGRLVADILSGKPAGGAQALISPDRYA